jgi:hypothetical protein
VVLLMSFFLPAHESRSTLNLTRRGRPEAKHAASTGADDRGNVGSALGGRVPQERVDLGVKRPVSGQGLAVCRAQGRGRNCAAVTAATGPIDIFLNHDNH